ncbi:hypothetical protein [Algoriphagus antarcticus]|uniref:Uncharacterized protein n=1 Tax=Algoriphagus antarcticus TaxID=238540 RepID=A0A3E0E826_9BACT|nr:hypothetical protein [Algoriphagus antarcticus]REG94397.1 hypothetical protein C8N25_101224 [Algoriphagus antarcticus]
MSLTHKFFASIFLILSFSQVTIGQILSGETVDFSIPKTIYFGGERVWIASQAYHDNSPAESKIIYAELVNRYNESVAIAKMPLEDGKSFNFLQLPTNLPSDNYLLRVFTRVSPYQNLENGLVQQFITVFNRNVPPTVVAQRKSVALAQGSNGINLSQDVNMPGSKLTIELPMGSKISEVSVASENPFLTDQLMISSARAYDTIDEHSLIPELFGHVIEAKVEEVAGDTKQLYYLSLHGEKSALFTDRPDSDGSMFFDAGGMKNWKYLVAQADKNESLLDFGIISPAPITHFKSNFVFPELEISPADQNFLKELLKGGQVEGYYVNEFDATLFPVVTGFVEDRTYLLDDYTRFETVETVVKEYVQEVSVKSIKKKKEFRALDEVLDTGFDSNPLMLIDALPIFDSDLLAAFDPTKFEKLDVLTRTFFLNEEKFPGVMSFSSYKNDFGGFPIPSNGIYLDYEGIQPKVVSAESLFDAPRQDQNIMDWRTILFWSEIPDTSPLRNSIEITVPDLKGKYQITVKTITQQGEFKGYTRTFEVK